jgi:hypothetical protein
MSNFELEITLHRRSSDSYGVELRFISPEDKDDVERRMLQSRPTTQFDFEALRSLSIDPERYGQELTKSLFADREVQEAFSKAYSIAQSQSSPLRVRLFISPDALTLHSLRWELLFNPEDKNFLVMSEQILFSRYLLTRDWRPVRPIARKDLTALVVIANPANLSEYNLAPVDVPAEQARARKGLAGIRTQFLVSSPESEQKVTIENIKRKLRNDCDILYLVCHGALVKGEPILYLEDDSGKVSYLKGDKLVDRLIELTKLPRLVILASCQSAGTGEELRTDDEGALSALGPQLAEAGAPAVLAMQGSITMKTVEKFMPVFLEELQRDGYLDRAAAAARGAVREHLDWWMPVLFMGLRSGRLWYTPGFASGQEELEKWPSLINNIRKGRCTPILGPGLSESIFGPRYEIARQWAERYHFPMAPYQRENLPQVAQFLAVNQEYNLLQDEFISGLRREVIERYRDKLSDSLEQASLEDLTKEIIALTSHEKADNPYHILASLPLSVFITTDPSNLLEEALLSARKEPQVKVCSWYMDTDDNESDFRPTEKSPLVYQLFGSFQEPDSLVLTEDDYFDFLIGVTKNNDLIPLNVRRKFVDTALLFLGFQIDDWEFRVLFRSIMSREGRGRRKRYAHIAVQIDPEEGRIQEPERARRYLENYFDDADISIYWGSAEEFIKELYKKMESD